MELGFPILLQIQGIEKVVQQSVNCLPDCENVSFIYEWVSFCEEYIFPLFCKKFASINYIKILFFVFSFTYIWRKDIMQFDFFSRHFLQGQKKVHSLAVSRHKGESKMSILFLTIY